MKKVKQMKNVPCSLADKEAYLASKNGTPGATRTRDTRFRKPLLYPPELLGHTTATTSALPF
jgi:hypothetical protein